MESIKTTQLFSRSGIAYLYNRRTELDPGQAKYVESLYKNRKRGRGMIECQQTVTYKLSAKKAGALGWGRYYGNVGSLEQLEKEVRGTLCHEYYYDIDIVNCHFVLLSQYARTKYGKDLPEVDKYISNREEFLSKIGGNRDDAKTEVIRILYGGLTNNDFLLPLSRETRAFSKFLSKQPDLVELFESLKHEKNIYGSFLSFILQEEEKQCMLAMKESLEKQGWSVDVLAYDGVMIRKEGKPFPDLKTTMADVLTTTGYDISLVQKEMIYYDIPKLTEEICPGVTRDAYTEMKNDFEMDNFYYMPSNEMVEVCGREMTRMSLEHAREYYSAKWRFTVSSKFDDYVTFFDLWRKDANRRIIRSIDMKPSTDPSVFVMTPKFAWADDAPASPLAVQKFLELIKLFGGEAQQDYIIKWMAQIVQCPFEITGTGLVVTGTKGCGKDTLFDFFMKWVIGQMYTMNYGCGGAQFFDKHDTGRMNKFVCKVEEANKDIFKKNADKFKPLITSETEIFNGKNQKPLTVANYNRFILTTNGACPVEMSNGERRYIVARCSTLRKGDFEYWNDIRTVLFNSGAGSAVGQYLSEIDLTGFNFRQIPEDAFQSEIVDTEKTSEEHFVEQWDGTPQMAGELFRLYKHFCASNDFPHAQNVASFGKRMLPLLRDGKVIRSKKNDGNYYSK
jgi:hypothetical protein